jgi:enamine deaminase RidA (YjgF/YER057c/UK114 family)
MRASALVALVCALAFVASPSQKKKKEEETQTLQLPKELPGAVTGETRRLTFHVTPLSAKGLLSQQVRDALKALARETGSEEVLKIRAFVAGSGDIRRVRDLVSETFTERRQPLPSLSLIQAGGLPLEGAQVVLEAIASAKKEVNPNGLAFLSATVATSGDPLDPVPPLTVKSLAALRRELQAAGSEPADVLRVTCFLSSLDNVAETRKLVVADYPRAALNLVQTQRAPVSAMAACEAVARLRAKTPDRLRVVNPSEGQSDAAVVGSARVVLTGTQASFGYQEQDARLAFERLQKALQQAGVSTGDVAFAHIYPLSGGIANQVRKVRGEFFSADRPPAGSLIPFEGLPSMDAGFAVDVVAVKD